MIFVFGSNLAGRHGKGAALSARQCYGAQYGVGVGMTGRAYAIPTKDARLRTLPLAVVTTHVHDFIEYAKIHPGVNFQVTRIGCGLAGFSEKDIQPLFVEAPDNCYLPQGWRSETRTD